MLEARAKTPYPVRAFTGREYVPYEWRLVPEGSEDEARRQPDLELREAETEPEPEPEATEAAAELAAERGVDLNHLEGTGAGGRILVSDVEAAIAATGEE